MANTQSTLPDFVDLLFPIDYSYGCTTSIVNSVDISQDVGGYEKRNLNWADPLRTYTITHTNKTPEEIRQLVRFVNQFHGQAISFKFLEWTDYDVLKEEGIGNEDGLLTGLPYIELWKKYEYSTLLPYYARRIKLIARTQDYDLMDGYELDKPFKCYMDGVDKTSEYTLDAVNGLVYLPAISSINIRIISKETNGIVETYDPHGFSSNDKIYLQNVNNGAILNNALFGITVIDSNHFYLNYDTSNITTATMSGGTASKYKQDNGFFQWQGEFFVKVRFGEEEQEITYNDWQAYTLPLTMQEIR